MPTNSYISMLSNLRDRMQNSSYKTELSNYIDVDNIENSELCADYMLFALHGIVLNVNVSIKTAINKNLTSTTSNFYCMEVSHNNILNDFAIDWGNMETYFNTTTLTNKDAIYNWLLAFTLSVAIRMGFEDYIKTWDSMNDNERNTKTIDFAQNFYNSLEILSPQAIRSNNSAPWGFFDLSTAVPSFANNIKAYSYLIAGDLDHNVNSSIFEHFLVSRASNIVVNSSFNENDFIIDSERVYNDFEKERINNNKLIKGYVATENDKEILKRIFNSIKHENRGPAIFYYGESGAGKSEKGKYFAKKLGLPYTFICCSATTNESDLRGKPQSLGTNGGIISFLKKVIKNLWDRDIEISKSQECDEITYSLTELVLACKYGWVIEIQEPTLIVNAGTLGFLNCVLDNNRTLILPNGEQVKVHPNTTFIFTTNLLYEGCNLLNNSLLSRMDYVVEVNRPTTEEQFARVKSVTGYTGNDSDIKKVIQAVNEINEIIKDNEITQGICDLRCAISCVIDYMNNGEESWRQSARLTIEDKAILEPGFKETVHEKLNSIFGDEDDLF